MRDSTRESTNHNSGVFNVAFHNSSLNSWRDPQWLEFLGVLLLPALLSLFSGNPSQISFYFGTAIYVSSLKWVGWIALGRNKRSTALDFPVHVFVGLGLLVAWFYVRNVIGRFMPFSYGLGELKIVWLIALIIHLTTAGFDLIRHKNFDLRLLLKNAVLFVPYVALLIIILEKMARHLHTASTDPLVHSFLAHVYLQSGIFVTGSLAYIGQDGLVYPSGFGAINAVTCALSTLDTNQAVNLQHVFLLVTALYLVVKLIIETLEKVFLVLLLSPLLFLWAFPIHNLYSAFNYEGTPRQASVGLFVAVMLLPMFSPKLTKPGRLLLFVSWAMLAMLIITSNPSCAPFAILAVLSGISIEAAVFVPASTAALIKMFVVRLALFISVLLFVFSIDPYYSRLFLEGRATNVQNQTSAPHGGFFLVKGINEMLDVSPLQLTASFYAGNQTGFFADTIVLTVGSLFLLGWLLYLLYRARLPEQQQLYTCKMLIIAGASLAIWLVLRTSTLLFHFGIDAGSWDLSLLKSYILFNLIRYEYVLWYLSAMAATGAVIACLDNLCRRHRDLSIVVAITATCFPWAISHQFDNDSVFFRGRAGLTIRSVDSNGQITSDDLELAKWVDNTVQPGTGWIALDVRNFMAETPFGFSEKHVYPVDGAQAYYLTSSKYDFCFTIVKTGCATGYDEYDEHVKHKFDYEWLRNHSIKYFLLSDRSLAEVTGYKQAVENQRIKLVKHAGKTGFYQLNEE